MLIFYAARLPSMDLHSAITRLAGIAAGIDNLVMWKVGYNEAIPLSNHLWTLSFELQLYAVIPIAFLAFITFGRERFILILASIWLWSLAARSIFVAVPVEHPLIWVTPFLHPDSAFIGILIALGTFSRMRILPIVAICLTALLVSALQPNHFVIDSWTVARYVVWAIFAGSCVWLAMNSETVSKALQHPVLVYLGSISYGLYVFHLACLYAGNRIISFTGVPRESWTGYALLLMVALGLTVAVSALSHRFFESHFLRLKSRFDVVPIAA